MRIYYLEKKYPSGRRSVVFRTTSKKVLIEWLHCLTFEERKLFRVIESEV